MINDDAKIIDIFDLTAIDSDSDEREIQIVLTYDISDGCYTIEKFRDGQCQEYESCQDRLDAELIFSRYVKDTEDHYASERGEYDKGRLDMAVSCLQDVLYENAGELDPDAARAIEILSELFSRGKASQVKDDLEFALATTYVNDKVS